MNTITLPILACSIYFAALQFADSRNERSKNEREKRLANLIDAKELTIQRMLWQPPEEVFFTVVGDEVGVKKGNEALSSIAQFIKTKFFLNAVLSDRITKMNGQAYHPFWKDDELNPFLIGTSAYAEVVRLMLAEVKSWPANERSLALMNIASRMSVDEVTIIYFAASTLPLAWDAIRKLIIDVAFFCWIPHAIALRFRDGWREGHISPIDDRAFTKGSAD